MKKWSSVELTINCDDDTSFKNGVKFTYTPIEEDGTLGTPIVFFTWENFYDIMLERYTDFNYLTGSYHSSVSNSEIELCDTLAKALAKFKKSVNTFVLDKQNAFEKLFQALYSKYDPISNYDKYSHITVDYKGKETSSTDYTGQETDTLVKSGSETDTLTKSGQETDTLTKSGSETNTKTMSGKEKTTNHNAATTETTAKTAFDSGNSEWLNTEKVDGAAHDDYNETEYGSGGSTRRDTDALTFTQRQDQNTLSFNQRQDQNTLSFNQRQDQNTKAFSDRNDTTEKSFTNRQDETNEYTHGNIGVTTTQQMITSQFPLTEADEIRQYIMSCFVHKYLIV